MTQTKQTNQQGIIANKAAENRGEMTERSLTHWVQAMSGQIAKALPSVITPERFTRMVLTALSSNPTLARCTRDSFLGAMMQAAQLGLEPNTPLGQAYLIPYWNSKKKGYEAQFQLGYKGMIDLAYRSGEIATVQAHCVYEKDTFTYELGLEPKLRHIPFNGERGELVYVYAMIRLANGGYAFEVMSADDVRKHAQKYSKAVNNGPWQTNFDEMAKKTVLKRVLKYAPLKSDFARGIAVDEGILNAKAADDGIEVAYSVSEFAGDESEQDTAPAPENIDSATGELQMPFDDGNPFK